MYRMTTVVCASLLLQACMTMHPEPTSGPRAQMRFVSTTAGPANVSVLSYDNAECRATVVM